MAGPLLVALPVALLVSVVMCVLVFGAATPPTSGWDALFRVVLVTGIFGGMTVVAIARMLRIGAREWSITGRESSVVAYPHSGPGARVTGSWAPVGVALDDRHDARPRGHRHDRLLRNSSTWLVVCGVSWYVLGRVLQVGRQDSDAPAWWWVGTALIASTGTVVWTARRVRWRRQGRTHSPSRAGDVVDDVAGEFALTVYRPAGDWVRLWAPSAFLPQEAVTGPSLWPWAATGTLDGAPVLLAAQYGQVPNRTGLTSMRSRTSCVVRLAGLDLPTVIVSEREAVPPVERHRSIALELEDFNRALWAWGPDARGLYAILHPRAMAHILTGLPDGAQFLVHGDTIATLTDEPVSAWQLRMHVQFTRNALRLLPTYLQTSDLR